MKTLHTSSLLICLCLVTVMLTACTTADYDLIIHNGTLYDGSGGAPVTGDLAISGDKIIAIGDLAGESACGGV